MTRSLDYFWLCIVGWATGLVAQEYGPWLARHRLALPNLGLPEPIGSALLGMALAFALTAYLRKVLASKLYVWSMDLSGSSASQPPEGDGWSRTHVGPEQYVLTRRDSPVY
ncbi:hypothetical protein P6144_09190 [Sphingomonas sp. HITSZ_GF]|uniref:hypothetical protein n=1 Tax=Sphingomonas sp. HITSZ_GF TaxID=3037247 RepID=UPI00240E3265|nr:hypothetical protein [Sphingomonas sp. HITSZ_GF]MDG2533819.1 hypothetical protein [Sphingomonas sp. HITSZ_GF]